MTILVTGSTGKTSGRLVRQLHGKQPLLIAGRSGGGWEDVPGVKFDWFEKSGHEAIFTHPQVQKSPITAVYLVQPPGTTDVLSVMQPFIELCRSKGVKRFVLLSATIAEPGEAFLGAVHKYLSNSGAEWTVLRPSWFMENFSESGHREDIRNESKIYSATGDGKIPFISSDDIAASAAGALTREQSYDRDFLILGQELLTYDDLAKTMSEVLGREIKHVKLSEEERKDHFIKQGVPADFAALLANLDKNHIGNGGENRTNTAVEDITGHKPITWKAFAEKNKQAWMK